MKIPGGATLRTVLFIMCALLSASGTRLSAADASGKLLGAYFEEWSIYGADYNIANVQSSGAACKLTHLLYAFANVSSNQCAIADSWADYQDPNLPSVDGSPYTGPLYGNFAAILQLKSLHPDLKVLISIGGASPSNSAAFAIAAASAKTRQQLAGSCLNMFITGNIAPGISAAGLFDGIDLDWEFPAAADKKNFTALVEEFRAQLDTLGTKNGKHYLLTIAAPAGSQNYSNMELGKVAAQLDLLNMETYDYHGTWETTTNNAAPLFPSPRDPSEPENFNIESTIAAYLQAGVPASKMLLGIPFYGYGWKGVPSTNNGLYQSSTGPAPAPAGDSLATDGVATFRTLETLPGFTHYRDYFSLSDFIYSPTEQIFWSYDDPGSIAYKMAYVKLRAGGLAGAFGWALKDDDAHATLINAMAAGLDISSH
ncbi:MAG: glycoside hydrolase family 18 protein [Acidobacteriaceae bacterium]|nr:glycoside hydrolase family 18 protein [Acidobacteriaceae bacterium]MBV9294138.1 glycoside hydrolase family 18 protein [Acidobacteriaceae bacterium]